VRKIAKEFDASQYLAKNSKELKSNCGVLVTRKVGKVLPQIIIESNRILVCNNDLNSRMLRMKDAISLIIDSE